MPRSGVHVSENTSPDVPGQSEVNSCWFGSSGTCYSCLGHDNRTATHRHKMAATSLQQTSLAYLLGNVFIQFLFRLSSFSLCIYQNNPSCFVFFSFSLFSSSYNHVLCMQEQQMSFLPCARTFPIGQYVCKIFSTVGVTVIF